MENAFYEMFMDSLESAGKAVFRLGSDSGGGRFKYMEYGRQRAQVVSGATDYMEDQCSYMESRQGSYKRHKS